MAYVVNDIIDFLPFCLLLWLFTAGSIGKVNNHYPYDVGVSVEIAKEDVAGYLVYTG